MSRTSDERLVPIGQAARMLGVSVATLRRWDKAGYLRAVRLPDGHRRFRLVDIERILHQQSGYQTYREKEHD